jgi:hypothetical protein
MTIRQLPDRTFAVNCDGEGCGQQYADEESGDYLFTSLVRMGLLMGADGWRVAPELCPACQPADVPGVA